MAEERRFSGVSGQLAVRDVDKGGRDFLQKSLIFPVRLQIGISDGALKCLPGKLHVTGATR